MFIFYTLYEQTTIIATIKSKRKKMKKKQIKCDQGIKPWLEWRN